MDTDFAVLQNTFKKLEECLLQPEIRKSAEELDQLLADDFLEITSTGKRKDKRDCMDGLDIPEMKLSHFSIRILGEGIVQTIYTIQIFERKTLRSSIWRFDGLRWQMIFHQGTVAE
ncbi:MULTISPECIES: DUF4440 domain-containing protein [Bacillaceae]|uniref:DUF4440 domain-containing protein n=1 Tax=Metabacillus sediminis TaxID=3117746 RepID=A0ABZ2NJD7_9BACI|nr:DUF4440 domain-containing protein [Bacillus sp. SJS]KZZ84751.1 hypothetical protein AS29_009475 [Bacillus sp. SJS]